MTLIHHETAVLHSLSALLSTGLTGLFVTLATLVRWRIRNEPAAWDPKILKPPAGGDKGSI